MVTAVTATRQWFSQGKGTSTPWGRADVSTKLTRGVVWYSTPGHGGMSVTVAWARAYLTLQAQYLAMFWGCKLWYEEDCKCSLVFYEHPELYKQLIVDQDPSVPFAESVRTWDPEYFDPEFIAKCKTAGNIPDLSSLQPKDTIQLSGSNRTYMITQDWITRGKQRHRRMVENKRGTWGNNYRLTNAETQGRLQSITREGVVIWTRPQ